MQNDSKKVQEKVRNTMCCDICLYNTSRQSQYDRHILTAKHNKLSSGVKKVPIGSNAFHTCSCGKVYKYDSGLHRHRKKCKFIGSSIVDSKLDDKSELSDKELMRIVIQQNAELLQKHTELQHDMFEVLKNGTHNNSNNKTFNIQLFLNETCKDAMNLTDFVESLKIQISDLDRIGDAGFATGISDIIVKELKSIDVTKRPFHCSDVKRETLYIRDEDRWKKGDEDKQKLTNMINCVSHKNIQMIPQWREAHPAFHDSTSTTSDRYNRIILGSLDNSKENNDKIMKNIAKEVKI